MLLLALSQIYTCISVVEVYRFGQCLGEIFSPLSTFFSLVSSCGFRDSPQSGLRCRNPNQCFPNFLKMVLLALRIIELCIQKNFKLAAIYETFYILLAECILFFHNKLFVATLSLRVFLVRF